MGIIISIIIPTYSPREEFADLLLKLVGQKSEHLFEIIVVDDATPIAKSGYIEKCVEEAIRANGNVNVSLFRLDRNSGPARARNEGVTKAVGEVFYFIDADCFIHSENLIAQAFKILTAKPNAIIGGTIDGQGKGYIGFSDHFCHWVTNLPGYSGVAPEPHLVSTNMLVTRQIWNKLGPFSENLRSGEDVDFCFRATNCGVSLWLSDNIRVGHFDRTKINDYFLNYFVCGSYRPLFYGRYHKGKNILTGGPRWVRYLLIPVISLGLTVRYLYRWASIDPRVFVAIGGILIACFAMALGCAVGRPKQLVDHLQVAAQSQSHKVDLKSKTDGA